MYQNRIFLIGFTGKRAEVHNSEGQNSCTVFSLATQVSYRDKNSGEYIKRTEWHRIVAWGKIGAAAANLGKGVHLLVEGELRSKEFVDSKNRDQKRRVWEIRAERIRKFDRVVRSTSSASNSPLNSDRF